ncbi:MAG TPA: TonB-dependent receptor [Woeseiaceae bacterium]|nr:TonB-dependent receptor [Woeseiaceae bacterium]
MKHAELPKNRTLASAIAVAILAWQANAMAQEEERASVAPPSLPGQQADSNGSGTIEESPAGAIDEVVVTGRFISASQQVINERITDSSVTDLLDAETISRLGDSTVSAALRRVPGLSLVGDKFVYIRGLGERYSATSLNGAQIPSPDLTRNVIPLDVFPTSIVQSLRVQKAWSADLPANFGGGSVDIRTKGIPDGFNIKLEVGTGYNSISSGEDGLTYLGGSDDRFGTDDGTRALSPAIIDAINRYQGELGVQDILAFERRQDPTTTLAEAQAINRELGLELNRAIGVETKDMPIDYSARVNVGNLYNVGQDWQLGFDVSGSYQTEWRKTTKFATNFNFPDERTDTEEETTYSVNVAGTVSLGAKWLEDHTISTTTLWLRNTDDETAITDFFNENREIPDGLGWRGYRMQFEEREMLTNQVRGTHYLGEDTRERFGFLSGLLGMVPTETSISWFYSESEAVTDIPNQVSVASQTVTDPQTAAVLGEQVTLSNTAGDFRFTDLDDEVENYGWSFNLPIDGDTHAFEFGGGWSHARKARTYKQTQFSLGATSVVDNTVLQGPLDSVFSDANVMNTGNNYIFDRQGTNSESYIAATMTDAAFGTVNWTFDDTWRVGAGARWEDYRQAAVDWNPYGFSETDPQVTTDPEVLEEGTFMDDKVYPAASLTYMGDFLADTFQIRAGWSETAVRPDLREITASSYIDPVTDDLTRGNTGVEPAEVTNYDLRAEWFFGNGDNFTVTYFLKEIDGPIEFFESAASDTTVAREIRNATYAEVKGFEIEGLKELGFLGGIFETLFVQGNVTIQDSELRCDINDATNPCFADAPTNPVRPLSGASEYVGNIVLGFDSPGAKHTASLMYNVFGERLYTAGRNGAPDSYEQPFHSLDFTYFWYPTESMTLKLKAQNILDESTTIERAGVTVFEEEPGQTFSISFSWAP